VAERAVAAGLTPILAGRSAAKLAPLAERLRLERRVFPLDHAPAVDRGLDGIRAVAHCAGPFSQTSKPMADACIRRGVHYLDITGEVEVFEALRGRDDEAKRAGVMLLPGAGFDVVPTDSLAVHVARRAVAPMRLALAVYAETRASRGTARTMIEGIVGRGLVRRRGSLEPIAPFTKKREFDFAGHRRDCMMFPMAELAACYHSTGIGEIETYIALPRPVIWLSPLMRPLAALVERPWMRRFLQGRIEAGQAGPTPDQRTRGYAIIVAEIEDGTGRTVRSTLHVPEPYAFTAATTVLCLQKTLDSAKPGFQTPGSAFGPDVVLELDGVRREDN
jgi:short subunit dehydrogenase-like uncharacterized protein